MQPLVMVIVGTYDSNRNIRLTEQLFSDFNDRADFQIKKKKSLYTEHMWFWEQKKLAAAKTKNLLD